jgi:hypothetical protein
MLGMTHVLVLVVSWTIIAVISVAVIRVAVRPISAKLDRVIALLETRDRVAGK